MWYCSSFVFWQLGICTLSFMGVIRGQHQRRARGYKSRSNSAPGGSLLYNCARSRRRKEADACEWIAKVVGELSPGPLDPLKARTLVNAIIILAAAGCEVGREGNFWGIDYVGGVYSEVVMMAMCEAQQHSRMVVVESDAKWVKRGTRRC